MPPYTIGCKVPIALIFKNIFKTASLSCYIIVTVKSLELLNKQSLFDKNLLQITHHLNKLLPSIERTKMTFSCGENVLYKIL